MSEPTLKHRLRSVVETNKTRQGAVFQALIQTLIVLSIVAFTVETLPGLDESLRRALRSFEIVVILVFTVEYLSRLYIAENRLRFVFSFYGIIDLLVILPFYLQLGLDLRSLRVFWFFRLFRLFKLVRYMDAAKRMARAFQMVRVDLAVFGMGAVLVLYLSSVGIYFFEHEAQPEVFASVIHSFWWALATLTTVGYGDVYPITLGGKVFTFFTLMIGLGVFAVPTGLITMAMVNTRKADLGESDQDKLP
jgi:voltage-gated potassium channel